MYNNLKNKIFLISGVTVSIGTPFPNVGEGDGTVRICVEIIAGSLAPGQTATVTFSTGSLSATGKYITHNIIQTVIIITVVTVSVQKTLILNQKMLS